jgi:hypothetical protein
MGKEVLQWPRMRADQFGCMLETRFGIRDARFTCALRDYRPQADPCFNADEYYAGPSHLEGISRYIRGLGDVLDFQADWEHGQLQSITLTLKGKHSLSEIGRLFGLQFPLGISDDPNANAIVRYPEAFPNIMSISTQSCSRADTCVSIVGFDHQGACGVDCTAVATSLDAGRGSVAQDGGVKPPAQGPFGTRPMPRALPQRHDFLSL